MALEDKALGVLLMAIAVVAFVYYTLWNLVLPFVDENYPVQKFFPDRYYAVAVPLVLLVSGLTAVVSFIALIMVKSKKIGIAPAKTAGASPAPLASTKKQN